jgi:hypothetical protein
MLECVISWSTVLSVFEGLFSVGSSKPRSSPPGEQQLYDYSERKCSQAVVERAAEIRVFGSRGRVGGQGGYALIEAAAEVEAMAVVGNERLGRLW